MGKVLDMARRNTNLILTSFGFENDIILVKNTITYNIKGVTPVRHLVLETENQTINTKLASVIISEQELQRVGFQYRIDDEVYMKGTLISFIDTSGVSKTYGVKETFPNESLGYMTINLGKYVS